MKEFLVVLGALLAVAAFILSISSGGIVLSFSVHPLDIDTLLAWLPTVYNQVG